MLTRGNLIILFSGLFSSAPLHSTLLLCGLPCLVFSRRQQKMSRKWKKTFLVRKKAPAGICRWKHSLDSHFWISLNGKQCRNYFLHNPTSFHSTDSQCTDSLLCCRGSDAGKIWFRLREITFLRWKSTERNSRKLRKPRISIKLHLSLRCLNHCGRVSIGILELI